MAQYWIRGEVEHGGHAQVLPVADGGSIDGETFIPASCLQKVCREGDMGICSRRWMEGSLVVFAVGEGSGHGF